MSDDPVLDLSSLDRKIEILEYSESYPLLYKLEKNRIIKAIDRVVDSVEHVGSTSVVGLIGKPTVDILIRLKNEINLDKCISRFECIDYQYIPSLLRYRPDRRIFWRGVNDKHDFHIHLVNFNSNEWDKVIGFRDRLRNDDNVRSKYAKLKIHLAEKYKTSIGGYVIGKDEFYSEIVNSL